MKSLYFFSTGSIGIEVWEWKKPDLIFVPGFVVSFYFIFLTNFVHFIAGVSDAPAGKPTDSAPQRISRAPKAPSSKVPSSYTAAVSSDTASQTAPDNGMSLYYQIEL